MVVEHKEKDATVAYSTLLGGDLCTYNGKVYMRLDVNTRSVRMEDGHVVEVDPETLVTKVIGKLVWTDL